MSYGVIIIISLMKNKTTAKGRVKNGMSKMQNSIARACKVLL